MKKADEKVWQVPVITGEGEFIASYSEQGLCRLEFPEKKVPRAVLRDPGVPPRVRSWHALTTRCVENVLAGRPQGPLPPLDLETGTEFQKQVWGVLRRIACGQTRSYSEVAEAVGRPKATRAVGSACGANPIPLLIPCHRVLAANQKLGGFSGGLHWKRLLLGRERITAGE